MYWIIEVKDQSDDRYQWNREKKRIQDFDHDLGYLQCRYWSEAAAILDLPSVQEIADREGYRSAEVVAIHD